MDCSTPGFPVLHYLQSLIKFMSIELVILSNILVEKQLKFSDSYGKIIGKKKKSKSLARDLSDSRSRLKNPIAYIQN